MNEIERQVTTFLLDGDHPVLAVLREQAALARVATRDLTGVGFFTHFDAPSTAPRLLSPSSIVIADGCADGAGLEAGAGFLLFIDGGAISTLECFTFSGAWPVEAQLIRLYYVRPR